MTLFVPRVSPLPNSADSSFLSTPSSAHISLQILSRHLEIIHTTTHTPILTSNMPVKIAHGNGEHPKLRRYKHSMRKSPYLLSLVFLLAATTLTILNIYVS